MYDEVDARTRLEELRTYIKPKPDLVINRVPRKELAWFKQWADDEFSTGESTTGDWGIAFKILCQGFMPPEETVLHRELQALREEVAQLRASISQSKEEKPVYSVDGKRRIS